MQPPANRRVPLIVLMFGLLLIGTITIFLSYTKFNDFFAYLQEEKPSLEFPNNHLKVHRVTDMLSSPTSMAFVDNNNILVLERSGKVRLISNGILRDQPVLSLPVNTEGERGLLGIATSAQTKFGNYPAESNSVAASGYSKQGFNTVFLYFTEAQDNEPLRNRIYRYEWNGGELVNPVLVLDLPAMPGPYHDGGKLDVGPDNHLYAVIGDLNSVAGPLQNLKATGKLHYDTSVILRIPLESASDKIVLPPYNYNNSENSQYYLAYGIRNSFGLTFDPLTGNIWDTENGEDKYDEINLVKPGFNSGWYKIMGPISRSNLTADELVQFDGATYSDPEFSWHMPIGVTDLEFFSSDRLGDEYKNNIFVGDINNGKMYFFKLNENRTGLQVSGDQDQFTGLSDLVADNEDEVSKVTFGNGFDRITDIETGTDGLLYVLSYESGRIYKITL
jgi:aldose sugar dehydrogenase